jgi:outer membrane protein insertion porin family
MLDHFFMGANLVRGFEPAGIGPRDISANSTRDAVGGTMFWGATFEIQHPLFFAPKDYGMRLAAFADVGSVWDYKGLTTYQGPTPLHVAPQTITVWDQNVIRSSVGVGLIWDSPFGPLRFDYAIPLTDAGRDATGKKIDREQRFRFSGGTRF